MTLLGTLTAPTQARVSIDDWIGGYADKRRVSFAHCWPYETRENSGKQWCCTILQDSNGSIKSEGFGHTTAEAFWSAVDKFDAITGGIYRSGK